MGDGREVSLTCLCTWNRDFEHGVNIGHYKVRGVKRDIAEKNSRCWINQHLDVESNRMVMKIRREGSGERAWGL